MWIESLYDSVWVNMKHITHFSIESDEPERRDNHLVYAYLDTSSVRGYRMAKIVTGREQNQARLLVCQGSMQECQQFVADKTFLEEAFQWVGYLVAGGIGSILTLIFQKLIPN